jgi:long-chain acyl-CoA synthetase
VATVFRTSKGINLTEEDVHLSYLPLPHTFERAVNLSVLSAGATICYYNGNMLKISEDIQRVKPTFFISVPRLYNRFYDAIQGIIATLEEPQKSGFLGAIEKKLAFYHSTGKVVHE